MEKNSKRFHIILECIQWLLIVFVLFACMFICPKVKQHIKEDQKEHLYQQIHTDKEINKLTRENTILIDSIENIKKDTVTLIQIKEVKKIIYVDSTKGES